MGRAGSPDRFRELKEPEASISVRREAEVPKGPQNREADRIPIEESQALLSRMLPRTADSEALGFLRPPLRIL